MAWLALAPLVATYVVVCALAQPGPEAVRDEPALLAAAERLVEHGQWAGVGTDPDQRAWLWHGPGVIVLLAPLVALEVPLAVMRFASPLLLGAALLLFYRLLRLRLDERPALLWACALGLYGPFVVVLGTIQKEPLAILLVVAGMYALARGRPARAGLALAALAMVRPEYGWIAIALLLIALAARRWRCALAGAVAVLACVPWLAFTHRESGEPLYWSSSSGLSLFWMSPTIPGENGQWHSPVRVFRDPAFATYRPLFRRLDEVHPLESDRVLRRIAIRNIRRDPHLYARNLAANAARLFFWTPMRSSRADALVALCALFNGALLGGTAWAARGLWRRRRVLPPETAPFALFALLAVAIHIPPSASPRMLLPIVPVLVWLIAVRADRRVR